MCHLCGGISQKVKFLRKRSVQLNSAERFQRRDLLMQCQVVGSDSTLRGLCCQRVSATLP